MIPVPEVTEWPPLSVERLSCGVVAALVPGGFLSRLLLADFAQAMALADLPLQLQRLRYDRRYAFACLGRARDSGDAALQSLALRLFEDFRG